jgi:hypothetical protein
MCSIWLYIKYLNINKQNLGKTNKQQYIQIKINRKLKFNRKMYHLIKFGHLKNWQNLSASLYKISMSFR